MSTTENQPTIVFFMTDQHRSDCIGYLGNPTIKTPNLDKMAEAGVSFTNTYTVSPVCMPARASFVSGLYPHNHGMWGNRSYLDADSETIFHRLQKAGYYTAYIGKSHFYPHNRGDDLRNYEDYMHARGLDYVHETTGQFGTAIVRSYLSDNLEEKGLWEDFKKDYKERGGFSTWASPLPEDDFIDSYVGRQAVQFIENYNNDKPLCLFVGFPGPHDPWDAPGKYATMYDPDKVPSAIPFEDDPGSWVPDYAQEKLKGDRYFMDEITEEDIRRIRANYYGKISLIDNWIGQINSSLQKRNDLNENLLSIFWSDHGEMVGDHQRLKKTVFFESSVKVPLIINWPGKLQGGQKSDALVDITDIYPTIIDLLDLDIPTNINGISFKHVLENTDSDHRQAVLSEIQHDDETTRKMMLRNEKYKYAVDHLGRGYMLYDLEQDPEERNNLVCKPEMANIEKELRNQLFKLFLESHTELNNQLENI